MLNKPVVFDVLAAVTVVVAKAPYSRKQPREDFCAFTSDVSESQSDLVLLSNSQSALRSKSDRNEHKLAILGFHVTSQALLKSVSAMLVSLACQIYANNSPFVQ